MPLEKIDPILANASYGIGPDPYQSLVIIGGIIAAVAGIVWPVIQIVRKFSSDKDAALRRNEAEITLYEQLRDQLELYKKSLDDTHNENRRLWEIIRDLEGRLKKIEHIEAEIEELQKKLEEKDAALSRKDAEIISLSQQLKAKEEKIKDLEVRVAHLESLQLKIE
jgi:predicted RNase H-like nuclease (RuvC/YqgF family)